MSWIRMSPSTNTCPGVQDLVRPTLRYVKCHVCAGNVEVWSDEDVGVCRECGAEWQRPNADASCLDYCEYAEQCRKLLTKNRS